MEKIDSLDKQTSLTSDFVIGTFPLMNSSSGIPVLILESKSGFSIIKTVKEPYSLLFKSDTLQDVTNSSSRPRFSPAQTFKSPKPYSTNWFCRSGIFRPVNANVYLFLLTEETILLSIPWQLIKLASFHGILHFAKKLIID